MDLPFKIRVETKVDDTGAKAAAEGFDKATASAEKFDEKLKDIAHDQEALGINAGLATAVNPLKPKSAAQPREVAQDLEPTSLAELELLRGAGKSLQNRLFLMRAIGAEEAKELETAARLESIQAALNTTGAKNLASQQAAGEVAALAATEAKAAETLGTTRQLRAVLRLLPADLGPLGMIASEAFSPWILAVGGLVAAYTLLEKHHDEMAEATRRQADQSVKDALAWESTVREIDQQRLDRQSAEINRLQHIHDHVDLIAEANKRLLAVERERLSNTNLLIDAQERLTLAMMKSNGAGEAELTDEQVAFELQKQKLAHDEKQKEIDIQRDTLGKDQSESQGLGASIKGLESASDVNNRALSAAETTRKQAGEGMDANAKTVADMGSETVYGVDVAERKWVYDYAKSGASFNAFVAAFVAFWGHPPTDQSRNYFLEVAAAQQSFTASKTAFENADNVVRDRERQQRAIDAALGADRTRQAGLDETIRTGTNAANAAQSDLDAHTAAQGQANAIDAENRRQAQLKGITDKANAGDLDAQITLAAATNYNQDFSKLFQGVTGQPFRGGDQFATVIRNAFKQHQDDLLDSFADLIKGTLLNGLQHNQEQIQELKRELAAINSRARHSREY